MSRYLPTREDGKPLPDACREPIPEWIDEPTVPGVPVPGADEIEAHLRQRAEAGQGLDDDFFRGPL